MFLPCIPVQSSSFIAEIPSSVYPSFACLYSRCFDFSLYPVLYLFCLSSFYGSAGVLRLTCWICLVSMLLSIPSVVPCGVEYDRYFQSSWGETQVMKTNHVLAWRRWDPKAGKEFSMAVLHSSLLVIPECHTALAVGSWRWPTVVRYAFSFIPLKCAKTGNKRSNQ